MREAGDARWRSCNGCKTVRQDATQLADAGLIYRQARDRVAVTRERVWVASAEDADWPEKSPPRGRPHAMR